MQTTDGQEFKQLQRHPQYYLNGGDVHFLLDNKLFRVHRYFFERESRKFRDITLAFTPTDVRQGDTDSTAIILDVAVEDFELLLGVFYNPKYSVYDWTFSHWTRILTLAQEWGFDEVQNLVIRELERLDFPVIDRIALYHRFRVDINILLPLYTALCSRDEPLDEAESEILGMKTTVLLFRARERLRAQPSNGSKNPLPYGLAKEYIFNTILDMVGASPYETRTCSSDGEECENQHRLESRKSHRINNDSNRTTGRVVGCQKKA